MKNFKNIVFVAIISVISLTSCHDNAKLAQRVKEIKVENLLSQDTTINLEVSDEYKHNISYIRKENVVKISEKVFLLNGKEMSTATLVIENDIVTDYCFNSGNDIIVKMNSNECSFTSGNVTKTGGYLFNNRIKNHSRMCKNDLFEMIKKELMQNV